MTKFTNENIYTTQFTFAGEPHGYKKINCDREDLIVDELYMHKNNLQETASGYGNKLTTRYKINFNGRNYRVYCRCFSNSGTCYIVTKSHGEIVIDAI